MDSLLDMTFIPGKGLVGPANIKFTESPEMDKQKALENFRANSGFKAPAANTAVFGNKGKVPTFEQNTKVTASADTLAPVYTVNKHEPITMRSLEF